MVLTPLSKTNLINLNNSKMKGRRKIYKIKINKSSFIVTNNHKGKTFNKISINLITEILMSKIFNKFKKIISILLSFCILQIKKNKTEKICINI